jgi:hypothetical protein
MTRTWRCCGRTPRERRNEKLLWAEVSLNVPR